MDTPRSAFITGTSGTIGRAIASTLTEQNWHVLGTHHENASRCLDAFQSVKLPLEDVSVDRLSTLFGDCELTPFDLVVHCAGNTKNSSLLSMSSEEWRSVRRVHLDAGHRIARAVHPFFNDSSDTPPHLVFVSSLVGIRGGYGQANYAAAKAGLLGLTFSLAREWSPTINVNAVRPPLTESSMTETIADDRLESVKDPILGEDMAAPEQTARLIQYIANEPELSGQLLSADHRVRGPWA